MGRGTLGGGVARSRGGTGRSCWDGKGTWSGREGPGARPDSRASCLPAHPTGGEAVLVTPRSRQPRTEPCPLLGPAQRRAQPVTIAGVGKALQSGGSRQQLGSAGCPCAFLPAGLCAAPRGPGSLAPRHAPTPRCAGPVRGSAASAPARTRGAAPAGCCTRHGKRSAAPHFAQGHGPRPVPGGPKSRAEPEGSAAPQRPRTRAAPAAALPATERL